MSTEDKEDGFPVHHLEQKSITVYQATGRFRWYKLNKWNEPLLQQEWMSCREGDDETIWKDVPEFIENK